MIRSRRPNLSETTRKARARFSRVHQDLRRPGALALAGWPWGRGACEMGFSGRHASSPRAGAPRRPAGRIGGWHNLTSLAPRQVADPLQRPTIMPWPGGGRSPRRDQASTLEPLGSLLGTEKIVRQAPRRGRGGKPLRLRPAKTRRFRLSSAWVGTRRKSKVLRHASS